MRKFFFDLYYILYRYHSDTSSGAYLLIWVQAVFTMLTLGSWGLILIGEYFPGIRETLNTWLGGIFLGSMVVSLAAVIFFTVYFTEARTSQIVDKRKHGKLEKHKNLLAGLIMLYLLIIIPVSTISLAICSRFFDQ